MIEISNLNKQYGEKVALHNLNLSIPQGELFAFLGPNGAGKTTTIKILSGLVRPTSGTATIGGFNIASDPIKAKALMSYVPDEPYLYDKLTAYEFMQLIADLYGMEKDMAESQIKKMSDIFELEDFAHDLCESFSHGMKQRVVLASALLHNPKVLVIDEPMVGLDPKSAKTLKDLLKTLVETQALTVFMSTHTLSVAEEIAHRIGIIANGEVVALGTLAELHAQQETKRGASADTLEALFLDFTATSTGLDPQ